MPALQIDRVASKKKTHSSDLVRQGPPATDVVAPKAAFDDSHMITRQGHSPVRTRRLPSALLGQSKRDAGVGE